MPTSHRIAPPLAYETSAYELSPDFPVDAAPWSSADLRQLIAARTQIEKQRREIHVDYYRIGHPLAFALPVDRRPLAAELPIGISTLTYPWVIWLSWALEERWRFLHAAWRQLGDAEAGTLLQSELAALVNWDRFHETHNEVGLVTAHFAAVLALVLADESGWDPAHLANAQAAADALLDRDVAPWFAQQWPVGEPLTQQRIHNIPVLALTRSAQLARVRGHAMTAALDAQAIEVLRTWARYRTGPEYHTEGISYDGYFMDSLTGWLAESPQRTALLTETETAFRSLAEQCIQLTLPGRCNLHVPLSDTEQNMPFWANALHRLATWYDWPEVHAVIVRIPLARIPAALASEAMATAEPSTAELPAPDPDFQEHPHAFTFRSGWSSQHFLVTVGAPRAALHHLHHDAGHLALGWQARFWITDPGYQQYRPGPERDYTIGIAAHNAPVINGQAQSSHAVKVVPSSTARRVELDLSACYEGLPGGHSVQRTVYVADEKEPLIVVRDRLSGLSANSEVRTHWLGGAHLAWAFVDGWARLSDGQHALWIGTPDGSISADQLIRHEGSRGPLTLAHAATLPDGQAERWWIFWADPAGGWQPPSATVNSDQLKLTWPAHPRAEQTFEAGSDTRAQR